jgi:hypothetical protein
MSDQKESCGYFQKVLTRTTKNNIVQAAPTSRITVNPGIRIFPS